MNIYTYLGHIYILDIFTCMCENSVYFLSSTFVTQIRDEYN